MHVAVLGPLEVPGCRPLPPRQRALVERLLVTPGRVVAAHRLLEELWSDPASAGALTSLHAQVSKLRAALPEPVLETVEAGYRFVVDADGLDVWRFEAALGRGRSALLDGRPDDAAHDLDAALALWRGEPFATIAEVDAARTEVARLRELHRIAVLDRARADLERHRPHDALARIDGVDAPYDDDATALAMLSLYRSGRATEALRRLELHRVRLRDDLGLEPGPRLRDLQAKILGHDASLLPTTGESVITFSSPAVHHDAELPPVEYARNGDVHLAYRVVHRSGDGPDVVWVPDYLFHIDVAWEHPRYAAFLERLASGGRLITYDKRGQGLSDRLELQPSVEDRVQDLLTVLDAAGAQRPLFFTVSEGSLVVAHLAHRHPERVAGMAMFGSAPSLWDMEPDRLIGWTERAIERWGTGRSLRAVAPSVVDDAATVAWYGRLERQAMSPAGIRAYTRSNAAANYIGILAEITAPCLVIHRRDDAVPISAARFLAEAIPNAELVELDGTDHLPWFGDADAVLSEVARFRASLRERAGS